MSTLSECKKYSKEGKLEEWIHLFLNGSGNNSGLSVGLKLQKRYYIGPIRIPMDKIKRICGPEEGMEFHNDRSSWEERVKKLQELIRNGWDMPPLIVENSNMTVRDGNHRYEALRREGFNECYVIIWESDDPKRLNQFKNYEQ